MKKHLLIWIPAILSLFAYSIARGLGQSPDDTTQSYRYFWYIVFGIL